MPHNRLVYVENPVQKLLLLMLLLLLSACDDSPTASEDVQSLLLRGAASVSETPDPRVPFVAAHTNGDLIAGFTNELGLVNAAIYQDRNGASFTVRLDDRGRPAIATAGDFMFVFENWAGARVDVAVVRPDGSVNLIREIDTGVDFDQLSTIASAFVDPLALSGTDWYQIARFTALTLSVAGCAAGIATGVGAAALALPCTAALVNIVASYAESEEGAVLASAGALGVAAGAIGCGAAEPFACAALLAEVSSLILGAGELRIASEEQAIAGATGALRFGGAWARRELDDFYFVVTPTRAADRRYIPPEGCWAGGTGVFVAVEGDIFTYSVMGTDTEVRLEYVLLSENVLRVRRLADNFQAVMDRTSLSVDSFQPTCEALGAHTEATLNQGGMVF